MSRTLSKKLFAGLTTCCFIIFTLLALGCSGDRINVKYEKEGNSGYSKSDHKHSQKKGGPPAHAKAHGYRGKHKYRYYPDCSVYHDTERGLYFYIKGANWEVGASLPNNLQIRLGESVNLELDTDRPYMFHADHIKEYPPGKKNKNKNDKIKKNTKHKWG
jgi:hypothetical protein